MTPKQERVLQELIDAAEAACVNYHLWFSIHYSRDEEADLPRFKAALQAVRELLEEEELA
jgi:hypothetical protein